MKISTLLLREPFKEIFSKTIEKFLYDKTNIKHKVIWNNTHNVGKDEAQKWQCNSNINSIFLKNSKPEIFSSINGEYSYNPFKPWKSIIQKIYLVFAQSRITSSFFADNYINIYPHIIDSEYKLFIGGNTKVRLIDLKKKKVYVILKDGFDSKFIENELYIKSNFKYIPTPKIIDSTSNFWYSEEYINGLPPNRLPAETGNKKIIEACSILNRMHKETLKKVSFNKYISNISERLEKKIHINTQLSKNTKDSLSTIVKKIVILLEDNMEEFINLANAHGDFHQGNILTDKNETWILDWEHSGEKSLTYDLVIFLLDSRIEDGFSSRFIKIIENDLSDLKKEICISWPEGNWNNLCFRLTSLLIFLLEDIEFYLEETSNKLFFKKNNTLSRRCDEICEIMKHISNKIKSI